MRVVNFFKRIPTFLKEVRQELKKVSWSTREELINATIVVLIGTSLLTVFIALADSILVRLLKILIQ